MRFELKRLAAAPARNLETHYRHLEEILLTNQNLCNDRLLKFVLGVGRTDRLGYDRGDRRNGDIVTILVQLSMRVELIKSCPLAIDPMHFLESNTILIHGANLISGALGDTK